MRHRMIGTIVVAALAVTGTAWSAGLKLPPGRWWENPRLVERLQLTKTQQESIRKALYHHAERMIDLNAAVKHRELALRELVATDEWNEQQVRAAFAALQEARSQLEQERFDMLLEVRKVLTARQWAELRKMRRERAARRPGHHPPRRGDRPGGAPPAPPRDRGPAPDGR